MAIKEYSETVVIDPDEVTFPGDEATTNTAVARPNAVGALVIDDPATAMRGALPILGLTHGVGTLATKFNPGDLVLGEDSLLVTKGQELKVIFLVGELYWKEYLNKEQYAAGLKPREFRTEAEVNANGGSTTWGKDGQAPTFKPAGKFVVAIEKPANVVSDYFTTDFKGTKWALARWFLDKSAYSRKGGKGVGDILIRKLKGELAPRGADAMLSGIWIVKTQVEKLPNGNTLVSPCIELKGQLTPDEVGALRGILPAAF